MKYSEFYYFAFAIGLGLVFKNNPDQDPSALGREIFKEELGMEGVVFVYGGDFSLWVSREL